MADLFGKSLLFRGLERCKPMLDKEYVERRIGPLSNAD